MTKPHRGRLQAQSNNLEESESWAQDDPPTWKEGVEMLKKLEEKLSKKELQKRKEQFKQAERFITHAGKSGGVCSPLKKSFENDKFDDGTRVDIEVSSGWFAVAAFSIALIIIILIL